MSYQWQSSVISLIARILSGPHAGKLLTNTPAGLFKIVLQNVAPGQFAPPVDFFAPPIPFGHFPYGVNVEPDV